MVSPRYLLEICVDSTVGAETAIAGGADRLEICADLARDGLSPDPDWALTVRSLSMIPQLWMVRPLPGPFHADAGQLAKMCEEIRRARDAGADGVVCGLLTPQGRIDRPALDALVDAAGPLPLTFHRAFDHCCDPLQAAKELVEGGAKRLLSSGQQARALDGALLLHRIHQRYGTHLEVVVGGGVRAEHLESLINLTGAYAFHSSAALTPGGPADLHQVRSLAKILHR